MKKSILALLPFIYLTSIFGQDISTTGDHSPAVIAKNFSLTYGVRADAIEAILWIYEAEGYDEERRKRATENILKEYNQTPEKIQKTSEFSNNSLQKLGIEGTPKIANALEWDLFTQNHYISTTGHNSPAVIANGNVSIWYGIPSKTLRALATQLEKNKTDISIFESKLTDQVKKYEELKTELNTYSNKENIYQKADALLEEGELEAAEQLIELDFDASMRRQAYKGFIYGKTKELLLKYNDAAKGFKNAVDNDNRNSTYHFYYANNERVLAHYEEAIKHYEIALSLDTLETGKTEEVAEILNDIGLIWSLKGEYDVAIEYYEVALKIDIMNFGEESHQVAIRYNNLGVIWSKKGAFDKSIEYFEKALQIDINTLGRQHPEVATRYNNIGLAWSSNGNYEKALEYYNKALEINLVVFGESHPNVAGEYNNIGLIWNSEGDYDKAIEYFGKSLDINTDIFGENHPEIAKVCNNLGVAWRKKGKHDKTIEYYNKALVIYLATFGEHHPDVATLYNNLSSAWSSRGEYVKAIEYCEKALKIYIEMVGTEHPDVAGVFINLGQIWESKMKFDKAIEYYKQSQKILYQFFEPEHPTYILVTKSLSRASQSRGLELFKEKKYNDALLYYQEALQNAKIIEDIDLYYSSINNIGSAQKHLKEYEAGLQYLDEGLIKATQLNNEIDQEIKKQFPQELINVPEVQEKIAEIKKLSLIRRMQFHKIGCLKGLKRRKDADVLAQHLWYDCIKAKDLQLLKDLKDEGYDFNK